MSAPGSFTVTIHDRAPDATEDDGPPVLIGCRLRNVPGEEIFVMIPVEQAEVMAAQLSLAAEHGRLPPDQRPMAQGVISPVGVGGGPRN